MVIASCLVELDLPAVFSLKEKRSAIKPILARLPRQFNLAVAEVDRQDQWHHATLALVTVGNDSRYLHGVLQKAVTWIEQQFPETPLLDYTIEIS
jgi:uncharacterized protein YlxP (DUF503 family)